MCEKKASRSSTTSLSFVKMPSPKPQHPTASEDLPKYASCYVVHATFTQAIFLRAKRMNGATVVAIANISELRHTSRTKLRTWRIRLARRSRNWKSVRGSFFTPCSMMRWTRVHARYITRCWRWWLTFWGTFRYRA